MKLFTYGDSWTEGVGGDLKEEKTTDVPKERTLIRHKYCWPKYLSNLLNCEFENYGVGSFSNNAIFNSISYQLKNNIITKDDFVIIMWSSSLRDSLPFFPNEDNFFLWGERYKGKEHLYEFIYNRGESNYNSFDRVEKDFRDFYITNLFSDTYYDILNQNYILYLQFAFQQMGIRYLFCDAFDTMIRQNIFNNVNKTNLIDNTRYWGYKEKTFADLLIDLKRKDVWEDGNHWSKSVRGKHPSKIGYEIIAIELHKFISDNNLLLQNKFKNSHLI